MTTTRGVVGCGDPPAGLRHPDPVAGRKPGHHHGVAIFPPPDTLSIPAGLLPAGPISHSS